MGLSTSHFCFNDTWTTCRRIPPESEVIIRCAPGYTGLTNLQIITCNSDGQYNVERPKCHINCGQLPLPNTALILNGISTTQMQVPWHVAIYQKSDGKTPKYICGGSIVSPSVIISGIKENNLH